MLRPVNKQAGIGVNYGGGERDHDPREIEAPDKKTLARRSAADRFEGAKTRVLDKRKRYHLMAQKHNLPLPPEDQSQQIAWAFEFRRLAKEIKKIDEEAHKQMLTWASETLAKHRVSPIGQTQVVKKRRVWIKPIFSD
jgi:hypothetical protein